MAGGGIPDLVIPFRFGGIDEALANMRRLLGDGKKGAEENKTALDDMGKSAMSFMGTMAGMQTVNAAIQGMKEAVKEASQYITTSADKFADLAATMRGMAALEGKLPTDEYALGKVELAGKTASLTPQELAAGTDQFQKVGSMYVSPADKPGSALIEQAAADKLIPEIMDYAKLRKMTPEVAMRGLSSIIQKMPAGTTNEEYKEVFAKVMNTSEFSRGSAEVSMEQFMPMASAYVGKGRPFGEGKEGLLKAITFLGVQQETRQGQAGDYTRDLLQMIEQLRKHGKAGELGIEEGDDPKTITEKIGAKYRASGIEDFSEFWRPYAGGHGGIQGKEALQTAIEAIEHPEKGFAKIEKAQSEESAATFDTKLADMADSDVGRRFKRQQQLEIATLKRGAAYAPAEGMMTEARTAATDAGDFDVGRGAVAEGFSSVIRKAPVFGTGLTREQEIVQGRALQEAADKAFGTDFKGQLQQLVESQRYAFSGMTPEAEVIRLLKIAADHATERGKPPLAAPPAQAGRR